MKRYNITMFFPAYNEEGNIATIIESAQKVLKETANKYEILIVLYRGSTDRTERIIKRYMKKDKNIRIVWQELDDSGVGRAYRIGLENAKYENIFYSDSDCQFNLEDFRKFIPYMDKYDIIAGYKIERKDPFIRIIISKTYNTIVRVAFGIKEKDVNTAFRLVKKRVLKKIKLHSRLGTVTTEMLVKAKNAGFKIKQVGVRHFPRGSGKPLYEIKHGLLHPNTILNVSRELVQVWKEVKWKKST